MANLAYVDSSALLKLVVHEPETSALEADLLERDGLVTSRLAALECRRAATRLARTRVLQTVDEALEAMYLIAVTPAILDHAAALAPPALRLLDAIHLATALSLDDDDLEVVTYDERLAEAASAAGLRIVQPGRRAPARSRSARSRT
ncbi:MAG TPA: type II toxin-antitoxin system VapC family toxin [Vicinamibacterales bacterium]|nr:type II toxin-antitoxin system VapC family toxin [Vicinamibacterales bacterium]